MLPGFLFQFFGNPEENTREKRELAVFPDLTKTPVSEIPSKLEAYYNDHLPFRSELVATCARLDYALGASTEDVLVGKQGWLFYRKKSDGDPMGSYMGRAVLSETEVAAIGETLCEFNDYLADQGISLVVMIAPNKERVYSEYLPDGYGQPAEVCPAQQVIDWLHENTGVKAIWLYQDLLNAKEQMQGEQFYYKLDSHWNPLGAYIGAQALMKACGIELSETDEVSISWEDSLKTTRDLYDMMGRTDRAFDRLYRIDNSRNTFSIGDIMALEEYYYGPAPFHLDEGDERKAVMIRDSFGTALVHYFTALFQDSTSYHIANYTREALMAEKPRLVVLELVERNVTRIPEIGL